MKREFLLKSQVKRTYDNVNDVFMFAYMKCRRYLSYVFRYGKIDFNTPNSS